MSRRVRLAIAAAFGTGAALVVTREAVRDAWSNLRRYSAPGAGLYDRLAGPLFGPFYVGLRCPLDELDVVLNGPRPAIKPV